ncbi:MAG: hypothetical protein QOH72_4549 [Solirubrobacteraceae bacterium]|nr:hypothetical protein [Solirubrobacteraceae bacterium]
MTVPYPGAHYAPGGVNLLAVNDTDVPGEPELRLLEALRRLRDQGWEPTVSTPGDGPLAGSGFPWVHLDVGGLGQGEGARAVASWPRALRLAQRFDVVYLNSTVCGRLLPALRGTHAVLHVHVLVDRIPRHWHQADVVLADGPAVAERLDGLPARVVTPPATDDALELEEYAQQLGALIAP